MKKNKITPVNFYNSVFARVDKELFIEMRYTFSQSFGEGRVMSMWGKTGRTDEWFNNMQSAFRTAPHNIHFTPAPRNTPSGAKKAVACVPALWTDIDNKTPKKIEEILSGLGELDLMPNLLVESGWGTYLFWLLEMPSVNLKQAEAANRAAAILSEGDTGAVNVSHTLRSPGSFNWKTSVPREVVPYMIHEKRYMENDIFDMFLSCESLFQSYVSSTKQERRGIRHVTGAVSARTDENGSFPVLVNPGNEGWDNISLSAEVMNCPLLRTALNMPDTLSYTGWMSLAGALRIGCGNDGGGAAFHSLSRRSRVKYNEGVCSAAWRNVCEKEMKPWGCGKTKEGFQCPNLEECKGILSVLNKTLSRKQ